MMGMEVKPLKEIEYSQAALKALRKKHKFKQTDVANKTHISRRQYQRYETEQVMPPGVYLITIGLLFGVKMVINPVKLKHFLEKEDN